MTNSKLTRNQLGRSRSFIEYDALTPNDATTALLLLSKNHFYKNEGKSGVLSIRGYRPEDSSRFLVDENYFDQNTALEGGGAICLQHRAMKDSSDTLSPLFLKRNLFYKNKALHGGAINIQPLDAPVHLLGNTFIANEAISGNGGAIFSAMEPRMLVIDHLVTSDYDDEDSNKDGSVALSEFQQNKASNKGGAMAFEYPHPAIIRNTRFHRNTAEKSGGHIFWSDMMTGRGGDLLIEDCTFEEGRAGRDGGGALTLISPNSDNLEIRRCQFIKNWSPGVFPQLYLKSWNKAVITSCVFDGGNTDASTGPAQWGPQLHFHMRGQAELELTGVLFRDARISPLCGRDENGSIDEQLCTPALYVSASEGSKITLRHYTVINSYARDTKVLKGVSPQFRFPMVLSNLFEISQYTGLHTTILENINWYSSDARDDLFDCEGASGATETSSLSKITTPGKRECRVPNETSRPQTDQEILCADKKCVINLQASCLVNKIVGEFCDAPFRRNGKYFTSHKEAWLDDTSTEDFTTQLRWSVDNSQFFLGWVEGRPSKVRVAGDGNALDEKDLLSISAPSNSGLFEEEDSNITRRGQTLEVEIVNLKLKNSFEPLRVRKFRDPTTRKVTPGYLTLTDVILEDFPRGCVEKTETYLGVFRFDRVQFRGCGVFWEDDGNGERKATRNEMSPSFGAGINYDGGIVVDGQEPDRLKDVAFYGGDVTRGGGAIAMKNTDQIILIDGFTAIGNSANYGGVFNLKSGLLRIVNVKEISGNSARGGCGAFDLVRAARLELHNSPSALPGVIRRNSAETKAGILCSTDSRGVQFVNQLVEGEGVDTIGSTPHPAIAMITTPRYDYQVEAMPPMFEARDCVFRNMGAQRYYEESFSFDSITVAIENSELRNLKGPNCPIVQRQRAMPSQLTWKMKDVKFVDTKGSRAVGMCFKQPSGVRIIMENWAFTDTAPRSFAVRRMSGDISRTQVAGTESDALCGTWKGSLNIHQTHNKYQPFIYETPCWRRAIGRVVEFPCVADLDDICTINPDRQHSIPLSSPSSLAMPYTVYKSYTSQQMFKDPFYRSYRWTDFVPPFVHATPLDKVLWNGRKVTIFVPRDFQDQDISKYRPAFFGQDMIEGIFGSMMEGEWTPQLIEKKIKEIAEPSTSHPSSFSSTWKTRSISGRALEFSLTEDSSDGKVELFVNGEPMLQTPPHQTTDGIVYLLKRPIFDNAKVPSPSVTPEDPLISALEWKEFISFPQDPKTDNAIIKQKLPILNAITRFDRTPSFPGSSGDPTLMTFIPRDDFLRYSTYESWWALSRPEGVDGLINSWTARLPLPLPGGYFGLLNKLISIFPRGLPTEMRDGRVAVLRFENFWKPALSINGQVVQLPPVLVGGRLFFLMEAEAVYPVEQQYIDENAEVGGEDERDNGDQNVGLPNGMPPLFSLPQRPEGEVADFCLGRAQESWSLDSSIEAILRDMGIGQVARGYKIFVMRRNPPEGCSLGPTAPDSSLSPPPPGMAQWEAWRDEGEVIAVISKIHAAGSVRGQDGCEEGSHLITIHEGTFFNPGLLGCISPSWQGFPVTTKYFEHQFTFYAVPEIKKPQHSLPERVSFRDEPYLHISDDGSSHLTLSSTKGLVAALLRRDDVSSEVVCFYKGGFMRDSCNCEVQLPEISYKTWGLDGEGFFADDDTASPPGSGEVLDGTVKSRKEERLRDSGISYSGRLIPFGFWPKRTERYLHVLFPPSDTQWVIKNMESVYSEMSDEGIRDNADSWMYTQPMYESFAQLLRKVMKNYRDGVPLLMNDGSTKVLRWNIEAEALQLDGVILSMQPTRLDDAIILPQLGDNVALLSATSRVEAPPPENPIEATIDLSKLSTSSSFQDVINASNWITSFVSSQMFTPLWENFVVFYGHLATGCTETTAATQRLPSDGEIIGLITSLRRRTLERMVSMCPANEEIMEVSRDWIACVSRPWKTLNVPATNISGDRKFVAVPVTGNLKEGDIKEWLERPRAWTEHLQSQTLQSEGDADDGDRVTYPFFCGTPGEDLFKEEAECAC